MKTGSLRILHLSDVHFGQTIRSKTEWRLRRVLGAAWKENLDEIAADGPPDIVCFTGDIAFSGQATEYVEASAFFDQLLTHLGVPNSRLFVVLGNHESSAAFALIGTLAIHAERLIRAIRGAYRPTPGRDMR